MAFVIRQIIIKPNAKTKWFAASGRLVTTGGSSIPAIKAVNELKNWTIRQSGFVGTYGKLLDPTTYESVYIFSNDDLGNSFLAQREENDIYRAQQDYFSDSGIIVTESLL
jgi:hypothetical protein